MASVKKTMKSSKTKQANKTTQAKQPGTPKAKTSKQAVALKAKRMAAARALAARKHAASSSRQKTKTKTAASGHAVSPAVAKSAARKKTSTTRAIPRASNQIRAAKKSAARSAKSVLARVNGAKRSASARARAKSVSGKSVKPASANKVAGGTVAAQKDAGRRSFAPRCRQTGGGGAQGCRVTGPHRGQPGREQGSRGGDSCPQAKRCAAFRGAQASGLAACRLESRLETLRSWKFRLQQTLTASPANAAAGPSEAAAKGTGKPFAGKSTAKTLDSETPPSIESRPGAAGARAPRRRPNQHNGGKAGRETGSPGTGAHKPAKPAAPQRQIFKPHEYVVYPAHGVGQIVAIEEQEVAGFKLELFVVRFVRDKMILKVPTPKAASVGMRRLADAPGVKAALDTLAGRARIKRTMWSRRAQEYEAKINSGDLKAIAEVVRDLYRSDTQPEQSYSERQLYETALDRMAREILVVQKLTETESLKVIETQLQKGPRRGKTEESEAEEADIGQAA